MTQPTLATEAPIRTLADRGLGPNRETVRKSVGEMMRTHTHARVPHALRHPARQATITAIRKATDR